MVSPVNETSVADDVAELGGLRDGSGESVPTRSSARGWARKGPVAAGLAMAAFLIVLPFVLDDQFILYLVELSGVYYIVVAGLNVVSGYAGQMSIGHAGIFGVAAYTSAMLTAQHGWPFWAGLVAAIAVGVLVGLVIGIPSLRLRHFYFAMVTMGFALVFSDVVLRWQSVTGGWLGISSVPRPTLWSAQLNGIPLYMFIMAWALLVTFLLRNLVRGRWGRSFVAVRESEVAAAAVGVSPHRTKLVAFAISGFLAGIAGSLYAATVRSVSPDTFVLHLGLMFFVMIVLGGASTIWGPVIGVPIIVIVENYAPLGARDLVLGGALIVITIAFPAGIVGIAKLFKRRRVKAAHRLNVRRPELPASMAFREVSHDRDEVLKVSGVSKHFGGVKALDDVEVVVLRGEIHAVIGPNGSGKTTLLNVMSGFCRPEAGIVELSGRQINQAAPYRIARAGLGRTFQTPKVMGGLSVLDNVVVAAHHLYDSGVVRDMGGFPKARYEERRAVERAHELLEFVGLSETASEEAGNLPHGLLRFVEIARALAVEPAVLLLDEPAGGLTGGEIDELGSLISRIRQAEIAVVLVEHNVPFVMDIADRVSVLDYGKVIAFGSPDTVMTNAEVIRAYLGV